MSPGSRTWSSKTSFCLLRFASALACPAARTQGHNSSCTAQNNATLLNLTLTSCLSEKHLWLYSVLYQNLFLFCEFSPTATLIVVVAGAYLFTKMFARELALASFPIPAFLGMLGYKRKGSLKMSSATSGHMDGLSITTVQKWFVIAFL